MRTLRAEYYLLLTMVLFGTAVHGETGPRELPLENWQATATTGAPSGRHNHTAVWTGTKMIVWGGDDGTYANTGGQWGLLSLYRKN